MPSLILLSNQLPSKAINPRLRMYIVQAECPNLITYPGPPNPLELRFAPRRMNEMVLMRRHMTLDSLERMAQRKSLEVQSLLLRYRPLANGVIWFSPKIERISPSLSMGEVAVEAVSTTCEDVRFLRGSCYY